MKQIIWFVKTYATFVVLFVLQKPLFLFLEKGSATQPVDNIFTELPAVIWHGLPLDLSMAGYLSVIPGFLSIAVVWLKRDLVKPIMNIYFIIASLFNKKRLHYAVRIAESAQKPQTKRQNKGSV